MAFGMRPTAPTQSDVPPSPQPTQAASGPGSAPPKDNPYDWDSLEGAQPHRIVRGAATLASPAPVAEPTPEVPPKPKHARALAQAAAHFGLTKQQIDDADPDELSDWVFAQQRDSYERYWRAQQEQARLQSAKPAESPATPPPEPVDLGPAIKREEWDESVVAGLEGLTRTTQKKIDDKYQAELKARDERLARLEEYAERMRRYEEQKQNQTVETYLDAQFSKDAEIFGTGSVRQLKPDSPELMRRQAVWQYMLQLQQQGRITDFEKDLEAVKQALFGHLSSIPRPPVPPPVEVSLQPPAESPLPPRSAKGRFTKDDWRDGAVAKPSQRDNAAEPLGDLRAKKAVAAFLAERTDPNGFQTDREILNGFPD